MNIFKQTTCFFLLLLISGEVFSQRQGLKSFFIQDQLTQKALSHVLILTKDYHKIGESNEEGVFFLPSTLPADMTFIFVAFGYQQLHFTPSKQELKQPSILIQLNPFEQNLSEVLVTAKSKERELKEQPIPISVLTMKDISGAATSINDVLTRIAGVTVRNSGGVGGNSRFSVRGLEGKRVGLFIDEVPMSENSDFIDLNDIPIDMIERIEIYKGVVPPKLGGSSVGGAVNIVLKEYPPTYLDVSYSLKSFHTHQFNSALKKNDSVHALEYGIGGVYIYSENDYKMKSPYSKGQTIKRDHNQFKKLMLGSSLKSQNWWFDEVKLEPALTLSSSEVQGIEYNIQKAKNRSISFIFSAHLQKKDFLVSRLLFDFHSQYTYSLFRFVDKSPFRYHWDGSTYPPVSAWGGEIGTYPSDSHNGKYRMIHKLNLEYPLSPCYKANLNVVYNYTRGMPKDTLKDKVIGYQTNFNSSMHSLVLGLTLESQTKNRKWLNAFSLKGYFYSMNTQSVDMLGFQKAEDISVFQKDFGLSNALRYGITPNLFAKTSLAYDVRLPSDTELLGDGFIIIPSTHLNPERNVSLNLGMYWDYSSSNGNRIQLEWNVFAMFLKNMIRYTGGALQSQYQNFGQMRTLGVDVELKWDLTRSLYFFGNATYQDLRDTRKTEPGSNASNPTRGDRIPNIPYFYANMGCEWHRKNLWGGKGQETRLSLESSFVEKYYYDFEQSIYQERQIPRSFSLNMGIEHSFLQRNLIFGFQLNNLTNTSLLTELNRPLPGRNYSVKVRYIWK